MDAPTDPSLPRTIGAVMAMVGKSATLVFLDEDGQAAVRIGIVKEEGIQGARNNGPEEGSDAPDFSLTPLKFYKFKTANSDITQENADLLSEPVSLSDFKDDKPVALIFGSYT